jgi:hypothetical protein
MAFLTEAANRGSISTGYDIDYSLKLEPDNSESLTYTGTQSSAGNAKTWTWSGWIKRTELDAHTYLFSAGYTGFQFMANENWLRLELYNGSTTYYLDLSMVFRDTSAWYHIVGQVDTTQATAANRVKIWINGVLQTNFRSSTNYTNISQNDEFELGKTGSSSNWLKVGDWYAAGRYLAAYIAEWHYTDGVANDADAFGEFDDDSGIWKPKAYTGSYGTNGYYLDFSDSANLGDDANGSFSFTEGNITAADQSTDTPTNNFCTFNPLMTQNNPPTISEGATKSTGGGGTWNQTWGNMGVKNGKWYYEFKVTNTSSSGYFGASTTPAEGSSTSANTLMYNTSFMLGSPSRIDYYYWQNGSQVSNESTGWGTISTNDIIGIALDLDSSTKKFIVYKNGSALNGSGTDLPTNMQDEFIFPLYVQYENRADEANFGGYTISSISSAASDGNGHGTFEIAPPSGYLAICTKNIAETG